MRDNNSQIGGMNNNQKVINNPNQKSWQDNIPLFIIVGVIIAVLGLELGKFLGWG